MSEHVYCGKDTKESHRERRLRIGQGPSLLMASTAVIMGNVSACLLDCCFETESHYAVLASDSLCRSGLPGAHGVCVWGGGISLPLLPKFWD